VLESRSSLKGYFLEKLSKISAPLHILVGVAVIASVVLTWYGKLGGEASAFLIGTVVGYLING